jgi:hypothetical protein
VVGGPTTPTSSADHTDLIGANVAACVLEERKKQRERLRRWRDFAKKSVTRGGVKLVIKTPKEYTDT